jgi:hypothetical protein
MSWLNMDEWRYMIYDMIFINCNWVVTRWKYTFTHKQYNTNNNRITQIQTNVEECGPCPVFVSFTLAFALQLREKHGKISVRLRKTSVKVHYTYYHKHLHITKPSQTHTLQTPLIHTRALHVFLIWAVGGGERPSARVRLFNPGTY